MALESTIDMRSDPVPVGSGARSGREVFRVIYEEHIGAISAYALRRTNSSDEAADVVAETFLVLWRRFYERPDSTAMQPWLYGIARRVLANQRRGQHRQTRLGQRLRFHLEPAVQERDNPEELRLVGQALQKLKPADREILLLVGWEQLEPAEIARVLDISGSATRKRLHRARRRLRKILHEMDQERPGADGRVQPAIGGRTL